MACAGGILNTLGQQCDALCSSAHQIALPTELGAPVKELDEDAEIADVFEAIIAKDGKVLERDTTVQEEDLGIDKRGKRTMEVRHPDAGRLISPPGTTMKVVHSMKIEFGLQDEKTKQLVNTAKVDVNADTGDLTKKSLSHLRTLVSKSGGSLHWRYAVQFVEISGAAASKEQPKSFNWVRSITLGATIQGEVNVDQDDDEEASGDEDGHRHAKKIDSNEVFAGQCQQLGGPPLKLHKFSGKKLGQLIKYIEDDWAPRTRKNPKFWSPMRVTVQKQLKSDRDKFKQAESRAHLVVFGATGAGKSTLLNAVAGFKKDALDRDMFRADNCATAVTKKIESKLVSVDRFSKQCWYTLTDVPGFDDPSRKNQETCSDLMAYLQRDDTQAIHGLVLVANSSEHRLRDSLLSPLTMMERNMGRTMWDHMMVVLTHLEGTMKAPSETFEGGKQWLKTELEKKIKREFVETLCDKVPSAQARWQEQKNMLFMFDSELLSKPPSTFMELVSRSSSEYSSARVVPEEVLENHVHSSMYEKEHEDSGDFVMQYKNTKLAALYEYSVIQMEQFRECINQRVQNRAYLRIRDAHTAEVGKDEVQAGSQHGSKTHRQKTEG